MASVVATLTEVRPETAEASTLLLTVNGAPVDYRPGQYVTIDPYQFDVLGPALRDRELKRGKKDGPGYFSLSSDAIDPRSLEVTIKVSTAAPLPRFLATEARPGQRVALEGPAGRYCLPAAPPVDVQGFLHLCAGSGVAPNRGMIRHALAKGWPQRHLLVLQERTEADVLFRDEWRDLAARHGAQIRVRPVFSSKLEYVTPEVLREAMAGFIDVETSMAFLCGPNAPRDGRAGFLDTWKAKLRESIGFAPPRIITEG
jgi:3-ketosteroid 9alpha-monooxygenase subunit B